MTLNIQTPVRLQRSRAKDSRLVSPNGLPVVYVGRPGRWGNHWRVVRSPWGDGYVWCIMRPMDFECGDLYHSEERAVEQAIQAYRIDLERGHANVTRADIRRELSGKNLACWCKLGAPCHADVLLRVANGGEP